MLKKILALVFVLSVSVSSVSANSFWKTLFGSPDASALVDSVGFVFDANFTSQETIGNIVLNVRRTGGGSDAFSVDFTTLDNSATAPNDYTQTQITVNFAAGEDLKQVSIPVINDVDAEPIEYFAVQLTNPTNGVQLGSNVFNFVSIYPDEPIVLTFNATTPENQNAEVYFERAGSDLSATVTLDYGTANETAIAGQDYTSQNGTVIFLPNETVKTVSIPTINDTAVEPPETYKVTIGNPTNASIIGGQDVGTISISDDDQSFVGISEANDGDPISEGSNAVFAVIRGNGDLTQPVTVAFTTVDGSATSPADYTAQNGTLTFAANETNKTITVATINDGVTEPNEQFTVVLSNASSGTIISSATGAASLTDNNTPLPERLAFATKFGATEIFAVNDDDTNFANLTNTASNSEGLPDFNAINGKIVFACNGNLCAMNADGSNRLTIYDDEDYELSQPNWSATGQFITFTAFDNVGVYSVATNSAVLNSTGGLIVNKPRFSPDGAKILFDDNNSNAGDIYVIDSNGSNLTNLSNHPFDDLDANWSPDGTNIVFRRREFLGNFWAAGEVFTMTAGGTSQTNLTNSPAVFDESPQFSPGGTKIAFSLDSNIAVMNSDGTSTQILATNGEQPKWSPGGGKIAYIFGQSCLKVINSAGNPLPVNRCDNNRFDEFSPLWINNIVQSGVGFEITSSSVNEDGSAVEVVVKRTGGGTNAFGVDYATATGTATTGIDFTATAGTLNFAVGETSKTVSIPIIDDSDAEGDEAFTVNLSNATNGVPILNARQTITISANDLPTIQFATALTTVNEEVGNVTLEITRAGNLNTASQVQFSTFDGTATQPADYSGTGRVLNFAAGETSKTVQVQIVNDTTFESVERFGVVLFNFSGAAQGLLVSAEVEIAVSDTVPVVQFNSFLDFVVEGAGNTIFTATVRRTGNLTGTSTVDFSTAPSIPCDIPSQPSGCARAGQDYSETGGTLTFAPNETSKTFPVTILRDELVEGNEYFSVILRNPDSGTTLGSPARNELQINANEVNLFTFEQQSYNFNEGVGTATVTIRRTKVFQNLTTCSVNYSTGNGTATNEQDYTAASGTLTFGPLETTKTFSIPIAEDSTVEGDETFNITLSNPVNGGFDRINPSQVATIIDNEPVFAINGSSYSVNEEAESVSVTVFRYTGIGAASVSYETVNGTATDAADYTATIGTINFAGGETTKTVSIPIIDDAEVEPTENFVFRLTSAVNGSILPSASLTQVSIADNDTSTFSIERTEFFIDEGRNAIIKVKRQSSSAAFSAFVNYETLDGTAVSPGDYTAANGTLNFPVGVTELTLSIPIINDSVNEDIEEFTFRLKTPTNGSLNPASSSAKVKIFGVQFQGSSSLAIMGTAGSGNQAVIFPNASILPTTQQFFATGLPAEASPHGVTYFGRNGALMSDFGNSRILVVNVSAAVVESVIETSAAGYNGMGTIAISPDFNTAFAMSNGNKLYKISAPFNATSTITSVTLPGQIASYQTQAIVFNEAGRAFVYTTGGISVLDPPYNSVAFTIFVINPNSGAIAVSPFGNTILTTNFSGQVNVFQAPFSANSNATILPVPNADNLDGIMVAPNGQKAIVVDSSQRKAWAISAPFTGFLASNIEEIPLPPRANSGGFEDVGISADSQVAILTGNELGTAPAVFVKAPFGSTSQTFDMPIDSTNPGRGAGAVRFLPPSLAPTAAKATVSGRVTLARGRGLARTRVSITNQNGEIKMAMTNQFGYFRFNEIETGQTYFVRVTSKSYRFTPQTLSIDGDLDGVNFTAIE